MATHSSFPGWRIPWTEESGRLHTVPGVPKSGTWLSDWAYTHPHTHTHTHPTQWRTLVVILGSDDSGIQCSMIQPISPNLTPLHNFPASVKLIMCSISCTWLFVTPWSVAHLDPLSIGFYRQEYWSGLPFPPPGDLPNPGTKLESLASPALADKFTTWATWEASVKHIASWYIWYHFLMLPVCGGWNEASPKHL